MNPSFDPSTIPLRDIHLPEAISWWPLAFGWWLLAGLALVAVVAFAVRFYATRRHRAARRALREAVEALRAGEEPVFCAQQVSTTLRRFAMTMNEDPDGVAGLVGEGWLAFLDSCWEETAFSRGAGRLLLSAPYTTVGTLEREHCLELGSVCLEWIKAQPVRMRA